MKLALEHEYPCWETDPETREERFVWPGKPRFVSAKRARKLRKRGVPLMPCHAVLDIDVELSMFGHRYEPLTPGAPGKKTARYCWFETEEHYAARKYFRSSEGYRTPNVLLPIDFSEVEARAHAALMAAWGDEANALSQAYIDKMRAAYEATHK